MIDNGFDILIEGLRKGDKSVFDKIFRQYYPELVRYCLCFTKDTETAEEIVQDVFVKLWIKHDELAIKSSLKSYLYRAVHNHTLNYFSYIKLQEKYRTYVGFGTERNDITPLEKLTGQDLELKLNETILKMPKKCREVYELRHFDGLKNKEIAERLNISTKTVEKHVSKAISLLRNTLHEYLPLLAAILTCLNVK